VTKNSNLAVLIDADNAQASIIKELLGEVSTYGTATVKRAYGDWTTPNLKGWKETLHMMAIQPIQQFGYTAGKNSTDSSLIIDAMDLLHGGKLDGFCLVSSDSDFTRLATRIRESGLAVYGFGEKKTPAAFVAACDKFIYTEILRPAGAYLNGSVTSGGSHQHTAISMGADEDPLRKAIVAATRDDGFAALGQVGNLILKNMPAFDSRNYGCGKLSELVRRLPFVEVKEVPVENSPHIALYVRLK
jgi:uncharacterized LabA/DUF88 family protein